MGRTRSTALGSSPRSRRLVLMRLLTVSRLGASASVMVTSWPASANTCAMPWPIRPAPMTAILALLMLTQPCPGRGPARSGGPLIRDRSRLRVCNGPGSAVQHFVLRWARDTHSARRIAAIGVEDVTGVEVRRLRREEQERPRQIGRLAKPAFRHACDEALAHCRRALVVLVHPSREGRAEDRGRDRVDGDAGVAPFTAERLGDSVDRRLRSAI